MSLFPFDELHEMEGLIEDNGIVWHCPECGRHVKTNPFLVIVKGNKNATHFGGLGGLRLIGITPNMGAGVIMPQTQIDEFVCSDGSSGIVLPDGSMIYHTECSARAWSSNAPNNMWIRLKLLVRKIVTRVMSRFSGSH